MTTALLQTHNHTSHPPTRTQQQWLVEFQQKTHVCHLPTVSSNHHHDEELLLLQEIANRTGWPLSRLILVDQDVRTCRSSSSSNTCHGIHQPQQYHARVRVQSCLRGGKGGFGTLLKSSARQSGAKMTTDFGACRDLQGRRLRHVNDEIKLRKWKEAQERQKHNNNKGGNKDSMTDVMFDTPSGLYNWHLQTPGWADISKKSTRKIQRQFKRMQQEDEKLEQEKRDKKEQRERSVTMYVQKTTAAANQIKSNVMSAVKQGLQVQREKKRKREEEEIAASEMAVDLFQKEDRPNSLCTLSGDVVVEETSKQSTATKETSSVVQIQSQSDFSTLVLFLDKEVPKSTGKKNTATILYYEIHLVTGGLAQIGWANVMTGSSSDFKPNTEEGDGVGDDRGSYGYDGSRSLKFHAGKEEVYDHSQWKAGDVVGCQYNVKTGEISYTLNGKELGLAFSFLQPDKTVLFPALSCNGGEILELHVAKEDMKHLPRNRKGVQYVPVQDLIAVSIVAGPDEVKPEEGEDKKPAAVDSTGETSADKENGLHDNEPDQADSKRDVEEKVPEAAREPEKKKEPVKVESLDLDKFSSATELEELGLDRLKGALMAIGVKCGGSLKERAARLFSLKGVEQKDYPKKVRAKNFTLQ